MVKVSDKIIGACFVLMMQQYKKYEGFTLKGIVFTKDEIINYANALFPMNAVVKETDMVPSKLRNYCLRTGSDDSLNHYYRLCFPLDDNYPDLRATLEKHEVESVLLQNLPFQFPDAKRFVDDYAAFLAGAGLQPQEHTISEPRKAIWIAAAALTYNEYQRTKSTSFVNYAFPIATISALTCQYITEPSDNGYSANITQCTKDSYRPVYPFLIDVNGNRRIAQVGEVDNTRPENLPLDFMVNTITGPVPVRTLIEFIDNIYATLTDDGEMVAVEMPTPQPENTPSGYGKEQFLSEVYMNSDDYDKLVSLIRRKKNIILQGAPGTGKTFCAKKLAYALMGEKDESRVHSVQFHQSYSYEDFVQGYRPNKNGFALKNGTFYEFCEVAAEDHENDYFFIIDEMNRGNLSKIFGELFTLLEASKRGEEIRLLYSPDESFTIPENVYIIGLMNTADRSLAMIDYALRRRFGFFTMKPGFTTNSFTRYRNGLNSTRLNRLIEEIQKLNKEITEDTTLGEGFLIGHSFFCELDNNNLDDHLRSIIEEEIIPLLNEYWFDEPEKSKEWGHNLRGVLL